ncbi:MAG: hypothetical protein PHT07_23100 [Paludibacter sp.]|nr:hypothetical protein [Paludibacter sp.]
MKEINLKYGWILLFLYFITTATAIILITVLSFALTVFAGTIYTGGDTVELIKNLTIGGISEDTILLIIKMATVWIVLAPLGYLLFGGFELYHYLCERKKHGLTSRKEM